MTTAAPPPPAPPAPLYLVCSAAGKLVFSTAREEGWALAQAGVVHALLALFAGESRGDELRHIELADARGGATRVSFLSSAALRVVCVSRGDEPSAYVRVRLEQLHAAVVSLVSAPKLEALLHRAPGFDLRRIIGDTDVYLGGVVADMHAQLPGSVRVCRVDAAVRRSVARAAAPDGVDGVLYVLVVRGGALVSVAHHRRCSMHVSDLHLLMAMLAHGPQCGGGGARDDAWIPLCLPSLAPEGFVYVYVAAVHDAHVVLVSTRADGYVGAQAWRAVLVDAPCIRELGAACVPLAVEELGIPGLRGFVYVGRNAQQVCVGAHSVLCEHAVAALGGACASAGASVPRARPRAARPPPVAAPLQVEYLRTAEVAVLAWRSAAHTLCVTVSPWLAKGAVADVANRVAAWVRRHEKELFLTAQII